MTLDEAASAEAALPESALEVEELTAGYDESMVLRGVSLRVAPGEVLAVLGKNGMGKTTLLRTVMGLLPARHGRVRMFARQTTGLAPHLLAARAVAYCPQDHAIFQDLTVEENLRLGHAPGVAFAHALRQVTQSFPVLGRRRRQRAGTLSGGEQKMLIMARALLARPRLLLIDEITEGLQPSVVQLLAGVLRTQQRDAGCAILLIEQNVRFALDVADRYAVLARGEIIDSGDARDAEAGARIAARLGV